MSCDDRVKHAPDLKALLPHTQGKITTQMAAPTRQRRNNIETINGIQWYPYFVRNKSSISLSDVHSDEELTQMLNICLNVPRTDDEKPLRFFAAFRSPLEFLNYIKDIPRAKWAFFEYILGQQKQKLYFDVDIGMDDFQQAAPGENIDVFCTELISELVQQIDETFDERGFKLDIARQVLVFSSHSDQKRSFHFVIDGYAVINHRENYLLAQEVLEQLPEKYLKFIDTGMWSTKQQFRMYQSQKPHSNRPKIFAPAWYYQGELVTTTFFANMRFPTDPIAADALKFTTLFIASCVTATHHCKILPEIIQEEQVFSRNIESKFDDEITSELLDTIKERCDERVFQIYQYGEVKGSLIALIRKAPAQCSFCNSYHTTDNAYLTISEKGHVYFHCHGVRRHVPKDSSGAYLRETSKHVCDVSDLLPSPEEEIAEAHKISIINSILATIPTICAGVKTSPPVTGPTVHQKLRALGSRSTLVMRPQPNH